MEHDAEKRERRNSCTATNAPSKPPATNNGASLAPPQVDENRPQGSAHGSVESTVEQQEYGIQGSNCQPMTGNPSPRNPNYDTSAPTAEKAKQFTKEQNPALEPPVTKATLSELDVNKIVQNPKLRHDINFDPDLHFRPNLDGEKGRRKTQKANDFWETMRAQLQDYLMDREQFEKNLGTADWCLPTTLKAIRGILETLVPQRDRASVEETFNVDLLMQQFRKGVANLEKLALWLSQLLKSHCAPMRDNWVDEMVNQLSNGDRNGDVVLLVEGMRSLLGVLEAMKLDVANHQIRCLRPLLIEDTIHFEQKFFMKKIAIRRVDIAGAHSWYRRASSLPDTRPTDASMRLHGNTWDFIKALVDLTLPSKSSEVVPHTFLFDEERLIKLRSDMQDMINLEVCMHLYHSLEEQSKAQEARYTTLDEMPTRSFVSSPSNRPASPADSDMLSSATLPLAHHFRSRSQYNILAQDRHMACTPPDRRSWTSSVEDETTISSLSSSPQSSSSSAATTVEAHISTPLYLSLSTTDTTSQIRNSLVDILNSTSISDKWTSLGPSLALQILRSAPTALHRLPQFESHLAFHLSNSRSRIYQEAESLVLSRLFPVLQRLVESYTPLTSLQIFEVATTPKAIPGSGHRSAAPISPKDEITEIATRIAHIGIVHWRVWAPLAYLVDPDGEDESEPLERLEMDLEGGPDNMI